MAQQKVYDCGHKENMVVAGRKLYMATKGIRLWPNRRCMLVVTKRILWPNVRWMDDCGHSRRMVLATHEAYDHDLTQVVCVSTLSVDLATQGVLLWPNEQKCMIVGTLDVYCLVLTQVICVSTLGIWLWPHTTCLIMTT
jgi:hypothetical protein